MWTIDRVIRDLDFIANGNEAVRIFFLYVVFVVFVFCGVMEFLVLGRRWVFCFGSCSFFEYFVR